MFPPKSPTLRKCRQIHTAADLFVRHFRKAVLCDLRAVQDTPHEPDTLTNGDKANHHGDHNGEQSDDLIEHTAAKL